MSCTTPCFSRATRVPLPHLRCVLSRIPLHASAAERLSCFCFRVERSPLHGQCRNVHAGCTPLAASTSCMVHFSVQSAANRAREQGITCARRMNVSPVHTRARPCHHVLTRPNPKKRLAQETRFLAHCAATRATSASDSLHPILPPGTPLPSCALWSCQP